MVSATLPILARMAWAWAWAGRASTLAAAAFRLPGGRVAPTTWRRSIRMTRRARRPIAVTGGDISVLGGAAGNGANIWSNGTAQNITLTDSNNLRVIAQAGGASVNSNGAQTISLAGTGTNAIQVGSASDAASSGIYASGAQSVTAGTGTQSGSITLTGGTVAGQGVNIGANNSASTQTISTSGMITLTGGSAAGWNEPMCRQRGVCFDLR